MYVLGLLKGSFGFYNAYLVAIGLLLPKTEKKTLVNNCKTNYKNSKCGYGREGGGGVGGQTM